MMPSHFKTYVANFNRIRLSEMIDFHADQARLNRMKPSLVVHPWTGKFYEPAEIEGAPSTDETVN